MKRKLSIAAFAALAIAMAWPVFAQERITILIVEVGDRPIHAEPFDGAMACGQGLLVWAEWSDFFDIARCIETGAPVRSIVPVMREAPINTLAELTAPTVKQTTDPKP